MIQTLLALLVVLAAIVLLRALLPALGFAVLVPSKRSLRVVESAALGTRQRLHVVEVDGERLLLGSTDGSVRLLTRMEPARAEEVAEDEAEPRRLAPAFSLPGWSWLRLLGRVGVLAVLLVGLGSADVQAAVGDGEAPRIALSLDGLTEPEQISSTLQIAMLLTVVSVAPSLLLMATCFTRVLVVLALLRQATGIHRLPPNQVLVGLALFTTLFVMAPVGRQVHAEALQPYMEREIDAQMALERGLAPVQEFLLGHTRQNDLELFVSMSGAEPPEDPSEVSLFTLMPAFLISELRTAFEIGFMIYLPFLIIDIVIASMLISMGMIVLPPMMISLPFKLMLFVLLDGWNLVITSLVKGIM